MTSTTEIYTLSLHDALPISLEVAGAGQSLRQCFLRNLLETLRGCISILRVDRKSTRLNSSHHSISYDVYHRDLHSFPTRRSSDLVGSRWGGAITAAMFLEKFVGDTPWVHLDIAG